LALSDEERREWEARFRKEVEEEHQRRTEAMEEVKRRQAEDAEIIKQERAAEIARIRAEVREGFFEGHGYVQYQDSRGQRMWLTHEEYERRTRRRRKRGITSGPIDAKWRRIAVLATVILFAAFIGLMLANR
jgi:hypothetical protein